MGSDQPSTAEYDKLFHVPALPDTKEVFIHNKQVSRIKQKTGDNLYDYKYTAYLNSNFTLASTDLTITDGSV